MLSRSFPVFPLVGVVVQHDTSKGVHKPKLRVQRLVDGDDTSDPGLIRAVVVPAARGTPCSYFPYKAQNTKDTLHIKY